MPDFRDPAPALLAAGTRLAQYEIVALAGRGGFGAVYRAQDTRLNRPVALKVLARPDADDLTGNRRILREAQAASGLNHPNIVTIYEVGEAGNIAFIAMEWIDGRTLQNLLGSRRLPVADALRYAIHLAQGLAAAHAAGFMHRDFKPGNVMVSTAGIIKILDFGLAKRLSEALGAGPGDITQSAALPTDSGILGTFAYMSPEQAEGRTIDARTDIFAFGSVLYEMVTGLSPFAGDSAAGTLGAVVFKHPQPPRDIVPALPRDLDWAIMKALEKDPAARWQSITDLRLVLERALHDFELGAPPDTGAANSVRRISWPIMGAAALTGALLVGVLAWAARERWTPARTEPELQMLTADDGLSAYPAISRDGSIVVFASDRAGDGNLDLWVQQINGREPVRLTRDAADDTDPDLSPDRSRVVFRSERDDGGIYVVSTLGGEATRLAAAGRNPRFSPDGRWIAYWAGRETNSYLPGSATTFVIPSGGGEARAVSSSFAASLYPVWSPQSDGLLVLGRSRGERLLQDDLDWWVLPLDDGGAPQQTGLLPRLSALPLIQPVGQYNLQPLAWLDGPGGRRVLFTGAKGDASNIWQAPLTAKLQLDGQPVRVTFGTGFEGQASAADTADGLRIAYANLTNNLDIWALPLNVESGTVRGALQRITSTTSIDIFPSLSRDGRLLTFLSRRFGSWTLRLREMGGTSSSATFERDRLLLASEEQMHCPKISPDGQHVVYSDLEGRVWMLPSAGGTARRLCDACGSPTDLNADASRILLEPFDTPEDIVVLDSASGKTSILVPHEDRLLGARFSPDARHIAFHALSSKSEVTRIYVAPVNPTGKPAARSEWVPITSGATFDRDPRWSPQANILYFTSDRDGFRCLWAQRLNPATRQPVGAAFAVHHLHHARYSLRRLAQRSDAIGTAVGEGYLVLSLAELTGNSWLQVYKTEKP